LTKRAIAISGSPRKNWNTDKLIRAALDGAESAGAKTSIVHLYDLDYKGCVSCFSCKRVESYKAGACAMRDGLSPVLDEIMASDALIMGTPIYFSDVTGAMRSFWERLLFINMAYDMENRSAAGKKISCGIIYTMGVPRTMLDGQGYTAMFETHAEIFEALGWKTEFMTSCDTYQFDDYSRFYAPMFNEEHKRRHRESQFPADIKSAFEMGSRLMPI
jgi:multimeric flavodoxin WrbA